ncbi:major facilitator superfamily transporter [Phlegmacium glaucopus]|nr:major facilitator superfamily transporter [Phlegmacium glaucopus]
MGDDPSYIIEEAQPFLGVDSQKRPLPNPLPKLQLGIILLLQICEPITSQSIYPYINQLITELDITGGDDRKVGYYAGLIESLFFATEALTVLQWSRLSDYIGRKPVLLIGLLGTTLSMLAFGLSRTFWTLILSRCLTGLLNGNIGVMKSVMGELTDSTNRAEGYALLPAIWGFGATIGPLIGGSLSHPHERFPKVFSGSLWKDYPYFLPCLVSSVYVLFAFLIAFFMLKETLPARTSRQVSLECCEGSNAHSRDKPVPFHKLLVYPVVLSIANYVALAFLNISAAALLPLFLAMPLDIGGLDLSPPVIGYIIGMFGTVDALFQIFYFGPIVRRWGERNVFVAAISTLIPIFLIFPVINFVARGWGPSSLGVWFLLGCLLALLTLLDMAYGVIFIFITASAPNQRSLGSTNGLSQTAVSMARAIGPALSTSFFSFSVEMNILGGYGVYVAFATLSVFAVYLATHLPSKLWDQHEPEPDRER